MPPANHKAWETASVDNIQKNKNHAAKVQDALQALLAREANEIQAKETERLRLEAAAEKARQEQIKREKQAAAAAEKELARQLAIAEEKRQEEKRRAAAAAYAAQIAAVAEEKRVLAETHEMDNQHKAMNEASTKVGMAVLELQYFIRTRYSLLKQCACRLEMRERRPNQENFKDHVQEALEAESETMKSTRSELGLLEQEGKKLAAELSAIQSRLSRGGARREANIKRTAEKEKLPKSCSLPSLVRSERPPGSAPCSPLGRKAKEGTESFNVTSPTNFAGNESISRSANLAMSAEEKALIGLPVLELFRRSYKLVENCHDFFARANDALARTDINCLRATAKVMDSLDKRKLQNAAIREQLMLQAAEADQTIGLVEDHVNRLKRPLKAMERRPQDAKWLEDQKCAEEKKAAEEKWAQLQVTEAALEEMKAARKQLETDLRAKTKAMQIDDSCKILRSTGVDIRSSEERDKHRLITGLATTSPPPEHQD